MTRTALTLTALLLASSAHAAGDYVLLQLRATSAGHALLDAKRIQVPQQAGTSLNPSDGALIDWQLQDSQGRTLSSGTVSDPRLLRAPLEPGRGHEVAWLPEAVYVLRLPVNAAAIDLRRAEVGEGVEVEGVGPKDGSDMPRLHGLFDHHHVEFRRSIRNGQRAQHTPGDGG